MKNSPKMIAVPGGLAVLGAVLLYLWLGPMWPDAAGQLEVRLPIPENSPSVSTDPNAGRVEGQLVNFDGKPAEIPGAWPQFRGSDRDAIWKGDAALADKWPEGGPPQLWLIDVGMGYAGAAVRDGRVYVMDYDEEKLADAIRCLSLADGQDIWRYSYPVKIKRNHGMSRTIPTIKDDYLITMGPKCHVTCLDPNTGEFKWLIDLVRDYGTKVPAWYAGQCPLIEEDKLILGVGGEDVLMMAVDCNSGKVLWETPNPQNWDMTHSSVVPIEFEGRRMYVYCASGGVVGVSADDGSLLWETTEWKIRIANVPTPLYVGQGKLFLSGGYNAGSMMLQIASEGDGFSAAPLFSLEADVYGSPQQTPVLYEGHIYGVNADSQLACLNLDGEVVWTSSSAHKFGLGPYAIADGRIYVMDDDGVLTMAEATTAGYNQIDQAKVLEGPEAWGPMAFVAGRLIVRDMNKMACLDISEGQKIAGAN